MTRVFSIVFAFLLILTFAACSASETAASATVPPDNSPSNTAAVSSGESPSSSASSATPDPDATPIPTTAPDVAPTATPEPTTPASPAPSTVPVGIVKDSGVVIGQDVAFRKAPSTDSDVISRLSYGTYVQILKTNVDAQWHQVKYDGKTGYISRMYVSLDSSLDGYQLNYVATIVNCDSDVNVRSGPTTDSKIIGVAKKGAQLTIIPQDTLTEGWYQVEYNGQTAYVYAKYLDIEATVDDNQLSSLKVSGGSMYPSFTPKEYGYVVKATSSKVTITAKANDGVKVDVGGSGKGKATFDIPSAGMKTVRISVGGNIRYSVYISRNVLTIGTWNIKRGDNNMLMQGRLVYDQQPDIMGIQETFQNLKAGDIVDNLASLKTRGMSNALFSPTINYSGGGQFGIGLLSKYKLKNVKTYKLDSGSYEKRILQKAVVTIGDKTVSLYNTHFTYNTATVRAKQFKQVKAIIDKDPNKYKILTGDFNAAFSEFSVFGKGYTIINSKDTKYYDYSKHEMNYNEIDNIIVTSNIKVINSRMVVTKFSDHCPVFAYLILN